MDYILPRNTHKNPDSVKGNNLMRKKSLHKSGNGHTVLPTYDVIYSIGSELSLLPKIELFRTTDQKEQF